MGIGVYDLCESIKEAKQKKPHIKQSIASLTRRIARDIRKDYLDFVALVRTFELYFSVNGKEVSKEIIEDILYDTFTIDPRYGYVYVQGNDKGKSRKKVKFSKVTILYLLNRYLEMDKLYTLNEIHKEISVDDNNVPNIPSLKMHLNSLMTQGYIVKVVVSSKKMRKELGNIGSVLWGLLTIEPYLDEELFEKVEGQKLYIVR